VEYYQFLNIFQEQEETILPPHRPGVDLEINLEKGETVPLKKIYPLGAQELKELHWYIKENLVRGWIKDAYVQKQASPILFVRKKDGKLRLCVDYRELNKVTKMDRYPLPLISEALDRLNTAKYFTKLDIKDAYHNIRINEGDAWKTACSSKAGTYEYRVMPFGLCNAAAAFQRWINDTLRNYLAICCIVYLDDLLIYSENLQQHCKDVRNIIRAIRSSGMKVKPFKCEFHKQETEYLGFIRNGEGIKTDPIETQAIWK